MQPDDDKTQAVTVISKGTVINHYRIVEKIGSGGMGEVYLAEDTELNRKVALKFLSLHLCQDADCRARFKREAQAAAKLDHPNIVTVYEVGEHQGRPFFAMQHIEGWSLREYASHHELTIPQVLEIGIQIAEGLQAAHEKGVTHRDIKPANVLIDSHGRAKVFDFGLATVQGCDHLTKTGSMLGTIGYMSPEQVRGEKVDQRTDIFSLGVVLYEMITGQHPFKSDNDAATSRNIIDHEPEPLARYKSGVSTELQRIISKAMAKNRALRYQHVDEMLADLPASSVDKAESGRKMLAVLPFENLGSPDDEYFADGMTSEITARLAAFHELGVISRTSTMLYKQSTKSLREIARELGVDYVLEGTVLWDKGHDASRVRILPRLIRVSDDTHLWAETYQRPLTDVFAMQSDIAGRIAGAMNVTLLASENRALQAMPTRNFEAYEAYLRGIDYWYGRTGHTEVDGDLAVQMFQRAAELDSTFALAYAHLSIVHAWMYFNKHVPIQEHLVQAKAAVDRALELQPNLPSAHVALGYYYYWGFLDYDRALEQITIAEVELPSDPAVLVAKGAIWKRQGKFRAAAEQLERAFLLNPRNAQLPFEIAITYFNLREYASAERFYSLSIALKPDQVDAYLFKARNYYAWRGDTSLARAALTSCPTQDNSDVRFGWFLLHVFERNYSAALSEIETVSPVPGASSYSFVPRALLMAVTYDLMHDSNRARAFFDSARVILENELTVRPDDHRVHGALGTVYAGLGRKNDAIREGKLSVELCPVSRDAMAGSGREEEISAVYVMVGEYDAALDQIEHLLSIPSPFSVAYLRLDPRYDPLRKLPRYQEILEKYAT